MGASGADARITEPARMARDSPAPSASRVAHTSRPAQLAAAETALLRVQAASRGFLQRQSFSAADGSPLATITMASGVKSRRRAPLYLLLFTALLPLALLFAAQRGLLSAVDLPPLPAALVSPQALFSPAPFATAPTPTPSPKRDVPLAKLGRWMRRAPARLTTTLRRVPRAFHIGRKPKATTAA